MEEKKNHRSIVIIIQIMMELIRDPKSPITALAKQVGMKSFQTLQC